ncbi:MAG: PH domain-containing protein [Candidatus Woesearchaeota archaeon]
MKEFRPKKPAFVTYQILKATIPTILLLSILYAYTTYAQALTAQAIGVATILFLFSWYALYRKKKHEKTVLEIHGDKLVFTTGGVFSTSNTQIQIRNITHVQLIKPFVEHALYKTNTLLVRAAGSSGSEVHLTSIQEGEEAYKEVLAVMKKNGFSLQQKKLLQQEKPLKRSILASSAVTMLIILVFFAPAATIALITLLVIQPILAIPLLLGALLLAGLYWLWFMNQYRREYYVYEDCIAYEEGFLTKKRSVIPAENLAECNNNQPIISRLLKASNIIISTQGSAMITFTHMPRGEQLEQSIDSLAKKYAHTQVKKNTSTKSSKEARTIHTYKPDMPRSILQAIFLIVSAITAFAASLLIEVLLGFFTISWVLLLYALLIAAAVGISAVVQAAFTKYEVRESGVYEEFVFMNRRTKEFTNEKLVGVEVQQSILDRIFTTKSITFLSLSTSPNITFRYIKEPEALIQEILQKYGYTSKEEERIPAQYEASYWALRYAPALLSLAAALSIAWMIIPELTPQITLATIVLLGAYLLGLYPRYQNSALTLHKKHVEYTVGYFIHQHVYTHYSDVKNVYATNYRLTPVGEVFVAVGGQSRADNQRGAAAPNGFYAKFIPEAHNVLDRIDESIINKQLHDKDVVVSRKELKNTAIATTILLPLLPLFLWKASKYRYHVQEQRVLVTRGVWNKTKKSVCYNNIDHLALIESALNKLCKNATVLVYTMGSDAADLMLHNSAQAQKLHEEIQKRH